MRFPKIDGPRFTGLFLGLLVVGLAVVYANSFGIGFYFDDGYGIRDNVAIRSLANIPSFFTDPFTLTSLRQNVDIRPVLVTTFAMNYAMSGVDPWSYHAFNLVLHFLTAVLVFLLVRDHLWWPASQRGKKGIARWPAAAAGLFFALAPVNNQALNYMWARSALLCTAFYVAAFYALLNRRLVAAVLLELLALFTKAIALTLPAMFVIYDFLYRDRERHPDLKSWLRDWKELVVPVAPLVVADMFYLTIRAGMLPAWASDKLHERWVTPWIWCVSQWPALLHYVRIFVWPTGLSVDHDFPYTLSVTEPAAWGSLLVILLWIGIALAFSKRAPQFAFATLWFFVTLAPESTFSPLAEVVNDHRPYIASSLGLSLMLAWLLEKGASLAGRRRREVFVVVFTVLFVGAVTVGRARTADWADEGTLWDSTVATSPLNGRAWMNSGLVEMRRGHYDAARERFEKARKLVPVYPYLYINLSALELNELHPEKAVTWARQAVRFGSDLSRTHFALAEALRQSGHLDEAYNEYKLASDLDPNDQSMKQALAVAKTAKAQSDAAKSEEALMNEGLRLLRDDHDAEGAVIRFRELLAREPSHYGGTWQLARALDAAGHRDEAREVWQKMLVMTRESHDTANEKIVMDRLAEK